VGVTGARDGIGAVVTVRAGDKHLSQQLVAGDGYQCRNEGLVVFGLGPFSKVDGWSVRWPSGRITEYPTTDADREMLAIENRSQPMVLLRY
jgi:hypothetical protein